MKTTMKFLARGLVILALTITSCTKDSVAGDIGPIGPKGEQGIQGEKGEKGEPGLDGVAQGVPGEKGDTGATGPAGADGLDGTNGQNGVDGNANVRTLKFDISTQSGSYMYIESPELTSEVIENDLILGYLFVNDGRFTAIPTSFNTGSGTFINIITDLGGDSSGGYYTLQFRLGDGIGRYEARAGEFPELKIIIAKSSSITTGKSGAQAVRAKLKSNSIDINDYNAVASYFGIQD